MKFKRNGQRIKVRIQNDDEVIKDTSLCANGIIDENEIPTKRWFGSYCVGDRVKDHHGRTYIEVLSNWFVPESTTKNTL